MNTTYFLDLVAGNVFGTKKTPAIPTSYYIGLSSTAPTASGGNVTEPSGTAGYKRLKLTMLGAPSDGTVTNMTAADFPQSTANWGVMTHFVIFDAETGGNLLMYGVLSPSRSVEAATLMTIPAGLLELSFVNPSSAS